MDVQMELRGTAGHTIRGRRWKPTHATDVANRWLLLHGWLDNCDSFQLLAPLLSLDLNADIVALDLSGHGLSDHRHGSYHSIDYAAEVLQCADHVWGAACSFNLLGHSLGALVALLAAGVGADRVERLVLLEGMGMSTTQSHDAPHQLSRAITRLPSGRPPRVYASVRAAAEVRAEKNVLPDKSFTADTAMLLATRGTKCIPCGGGFTWRTDPWLMIPSRMQMSDETVNAFAAAVTAPTLLLTTADGSLARYTQAKKKVPLFWWLKLHWKATTLLSTLLSFLLKTMLWLASSVLSKEGPANRAAKKLALGLTLLARAGWRIRSFQNRTLLELDLGGHHPQLTQPDAVAQAITDWVRKGKE